MRTIITAIAIIFATITLANALARFSSENRDIETHCFKAEELEIEAEVLEDEALAHELAIEKRLQALEAEFDRLADEADKTYEWEEDLRIAEHRRGKAYEALINAELYGSDEQINVHKAHAAKLRHEANRERARAEAHQRKCEAN